MSDKPDRDRAASLGCGTLLLIALIVAIFSGRGELQDLKGHLQRLENQISNLARKIDSLEMSQSRPVVERK